MDLNRTAQVPISVIVPCWRCAVTIERAIASIAWQTSIPAEVILVDDASGDDTVACLYALTQCYPKGWIKVIELPINLGPGGARNAGWECAAQPYIAFLDADDIWHPEKIRLQYDWINNHRETVMIGHRIKVIKSVDDIQNAPINRAIKKIERANILLRNLFPTPSIIVRKDLPLRFDSQIRMSEDYHLWLRVVLSKYPVYRLDAPLTYAFKKLWGEGGLSAALWKMEKAELVTYFKIYQLGLIRSVELPMLLIWSLLKFARRLILKAVEI